MHKVVISKAIGGFGDKTRCQAFNKALSDNEALSPWIEKEVFLAGGTFSYFWMPRHHPEFVRLVEEHQEALKGQLELVELIHPAYSIFDDGRGVETVSVVRTNAHDARVLPEPGEISQHESILIPLEELTDMFDEDGNFTGNRKSVLAVIKKYLPAVEAESTVKWEDIPDIPTLFPPRLKG